MDKKQNNGVPVVSNPPAIPVIKKKSHRSGIEPGSLHGNRRVTEEPVDSDQELIDMASAMTAKELRIWMRQNGRENEKRLNAAYAAKGLQR